MLWTDLWYSAVFEVRCKRLWAKLKFGRIKGGVFVVVMHNPTKEVLECLEKIG